MRSFANLRAIDPGFRADHVLTVDLNLPRARYERPPQAQFYEALIDGVSALPGVRSVGAVEQLPLSGPQQMTDFRIIGAPPPPGDEPDVAYSSVTPGYFSSEWRSCFVAAAC